MACCAASRTTAARCSASDVTDAGHELTIRIWAHQRPKRQDSALCFHLQTSKALHCTRIDAPVVMIEESLNMLPMLPGFDSVYSRDELKRWVRAAYRTFVQSSCLSMWMKLTQHALSAGVDPILTAKENDPLFKRAWMTRRHEAWMWRKSRWHAWWHEARMWRKHMGRSHMPWSFHS
jgi:hypothetical protein